MNATLLAEIEKLDGRDVHNFCWGTLDTYFYLTAPKTQVELIDDLLVIRNTPGGKMKAFDFSTADSISPAFRKVNKEMPVYTITKKEAIKGTKFLEMAYDVKQVLAPESYPNAKKRYKRLTRPLTILQSTGIEIRALRRADIMAIKRLHDAWVNYKMAQPATFKMMFPKARYMRCAAIALDFDDYLTYGAFQEDRLLFVRILYQQDHHAYDLAFFGDTWDRALPGDLAESIALKVLLDLQARGIETLNCGASLNKNLHAFKAHWPSYEVISYAYAKGACL